MITRMVSGGQTGVDRAAFDAAIAQEIPIGGWIPKGRRAEDGEIPARYSGLCETDSCEYRERTKLNVRDSDATLIFYDGELSGGTLLTQTLAMELKKPCLAVDVAINSVSDACTAISDWLGDVDPSTLNIAGPRQSQAPTISAFVTDVLRRILESDSEPTSCAAGR